MCTVDSSSVKPRKSHKTVWCTCFFYKHDVYKHNTSTGLEVIPHVNKVPSYFLWSFYWYFHKIVWWFIWMKFLIAVLVSPFIPTPLPFINFGDFCQPTRLLHPPRLLFWPKFSSLPVYSAFPFYLKLESSAQRCIQNTVKHLRWSILRKRLTALSR